MELQEKQINSLFEGILERNTKVYNSVRELLKQDPKNELLDKMARAVLPYSNVSIHFSLKSVDISVAAQKLANYMMGCGFEIDTDNTTIHHCFLKRNEVEERGWNTKVVDFFEDAESEGQEVVWHSKGLGNVEEAREEMFVTLENSFKPLCIFIGDIIDGVETEYEIAKDLGIPTLEL